MRQAAHLDAGCAKKNLRALLRSAPAALLRAAALRLMRKFARARLEQLAFAAATVNGEMSVTIARFEQVIQA
jgi:hypothetical protein